METSFGMGWDLRRTDHRSGTSIFALNSIRDFPLPLEVADFNTRFPRTGEVVEPRGK